MIYFESRILRVRWNDAERWVIIEWKGYGEGAELRTALDKVLELLSMKGASATLSDASHMAAVTQEDQRWIVSNWTPRARALGLRKMAIMTPRSGVSRLSVNQMLKAAAPLRGDELQTAYFDTPEKAAAWLRE